MKNQKGISSIMIAIIVVFMAILIVLATILLYTYFYKSSEGTEELSQPQIQKAIDTSNWQVYKNEKYGYEIKYPSDAEVHEVSQEGNYTNNIPSSCIGVNYKYGIISIRTSDSTIPCGPTDIGMGAVKIQDYITIGGEKYAAFGYQYSKEELYKQFELMGASHKKSEKDDFILEFLMVNPSDINIVYGVYSQEKLSDEEYKEIKGVVNKIVESFNKAGTSVD